MILGGFMNKYVIATSSTADLPAEYLKEHNIPFISYTYTIMIKFISMIARKKVVIS